MLEMRLLVSEDRLSIKKAIERNTPPSLSIARFTFSDVEHVARTDIAKHTTRNYKAPPLDKLCLAIAAAVKENAFFRTLCLPLCYLETQRLKNRQKYNFISK